MHMNLRPLKVDHLFKYYITSDHYSIDARG